MLTTDSLVETSRHARKSASSLLGKAGLFFGYVVLMILVFLMLFPLVWMFLSSFKPGDELISQPLSINFRTFSLNNYTTMLAFVPLWTGFQNTVIVLLCKGALTLFFCPLAGFAFAKLHFRGRKWLFTLVLSTLMLPPIVLIIPLLLEMGTFDWVNTYQALVLPGAIGAFGIFWMRQQIAEVPDELLDAGRIDGCSSFGLFLRVVVPVIRPALAALAILTFLDIYNDFVWPVIVTSSTDMQTLQVMLSALYTQINNAQPGLAGSSAWGEVLAASSLATLPVLLLFLVLQRQFVRGILSGSVKG
ncbi:MAG TPA: carbohydrate ABC transporter permease [Ktedonobacteraceae bacterium]|nr:carbohydrate ABC transporter permease [Ktedonobacteraceae bacterium]